MKPVKVEPEVEREITKAIDYVETDPPGRGDELYEFTREAFEFIARFPKAGGRFGQTRFRKHILKKYKYVIVYEELEDWVRIVAFAHPRRGPDFWKSRLQSE